MAADTRDEWVSISDAQLLLRRYFRTKSALKRHLARRNVNGLTAADAVRMSPLGRLLIHPARLERWVLGEARRAAA